MQDAKAVKFFEEVLSKTRAGKIRWEPTADESDYIAAIGGHFTLSISEYENTYPEMYSLALKDQDGRVLTKVTNSDDGIPSADIRELYETARRQALRVDEKIDSALGQLSKL
jgi:hypothetical protein